MCEDYSYKDVPPQALLSRILEGLGIPEQALYSRFPGDGDRSPDEILQRMNEPQVWLEFLSEHGTERKQRNMSSCN